MNTFTMISRHGVSKDNITGYTLISADYQTVLMSTSAISEAIANKKMVVTNLELSKKGLVSTNGALDKYTFVNSTTNQIEGTPRAVILNRAEQNGKLVGYTVFTQHGTIAELKVADAVALVNQKLVSNGKIKHTQEGDIVSAIGGTYPLRTVEIDKAPKGEISLSLMYFSSVVGSNIEYAGVIISCTSATEMSKLADMLSKSNAKVISEVSKVAGKSVRDSLAIQRISTNSLYGVFETALIEKIAKKAAKVSNKLGTIAVTSIKYNDGEPDEAVIKLDNNWKIADSDIEGSEAAPKLKEYAKKVMVAFNGVKLQ